MGPGGAVAHLTEVISTGDNDSLEAYNFFKPTAFVKKIVRGKHSYNCSTTSKIKIFFFFVRKIMTRL